MSEPGDPRVPSLGEDLDIRSDVPRYRVFRDGELKGDVTDIRDLWRRGHGRFRDRLLVFLRGSAHRGGVPLRYVAEGKKRRDVSHPHRDRAGGAVPRPMAVSMRPLRAADAILAVQSLRASQGARRAGCISASRS